MPDYVPLPIFDPPARVAKADPALLAAFGPTAKVSRTKVAAAGWHVHRCPFDGVEWSHTDRSYGIRGDHTCPSCGSVQWQIHQHGTRIVEVRTPNPVAVELPCPPGGT